MGRSRCHGGRRTWAGRYKLSQESFLKKLITWVAVGLLTSALLDPLIYMMINQPVPWGRDLLMLGGGIVCFYLLIRFRDEW